MTKGGGSPLSFCNCPIIGERFNEEDVQAKNCQVTLYYLRTFLHRIETRYRHSIDSRAKLMRFQKMPNIQTSEFISLRDS